MKRVLYFLNGLTHGGAEFGLLRLIRGDVFADCDLRIAAIVGGPLAEVFEREGVRPHVFYARSDMRLSDLSGALVKLRRLVQEFRPDVLVLSLPQANIVGRIVGRMAGVRRIVAFEHSVRLARRPYTLAYNLTSPCVDVVWADCAETLRAVLKRHYALSAPSRRAVVPLVSVDSGACAGQTERSFGSPSRLICVGRLSPPKNYGAAIRAIGLLRAAGRDVALDIVGEGPLEQELLQLIRELGVEDHVRLRGFIREWRDDSGHAAFLLTSVREGLCIVAIEAMEVGLPVVAPLVGGLRDYADATTIEVAQSVDPHDIAAAIERCLDGGEAAAKALRAQRRVQEMFGEDAVARAYATLRADLAAGYP